jgi:hypothetical protein
LCAAGSVLIATGDDGAEAHPAIMPRTANITSGVRRIQFLIDMFISAKLLGTLL